MGRERAVWVTAQRADEEARRFESELTFSKAGAPQAQPWASAVYVGSPGPPPGPRNTRCSNLCWLRRSHWPRKFKLTMSKYVFLFPVLAVPPGLWNLRAPTRYCTQALGSKSTEVLTTGPSGIPYSYFHFKIQHLSCT